MRNYQIQSKAGDIFGVYEANTPEKAFAAMVADAGDSSGVEGTADDWIIIEQEAD